MIQNAGTQLLIADGPVQASGVAVRVFAVHIISTSTAAVVSLRNGTSTAATSYATLTGTISTGVNFTFGEAGLLFPAGCFVDIDANTTSVTVAYNTAS